MTQEEKTLLIKDICGRILYSPKGVILYHLYDPEEVEVCGYDGQWITVYRDGDFDNYDAERIRLYLRPMSSMTEEEWKEYHNLRYCDTSNADRVDFLNAHHLDYRGLIEKGLALEAPEGMYV